MILASEIAEQGSAGTLRDVVGDVKDPEPEDEDSDGVGAVVDGVAEPPADIGGVPDDQDREDDGDGTGEDERPAAAEAAGAAVAHVAHKWLHEEPREWPTQPYDAGPRVRDPKLLHVRREQ